MNIVKLEVPCMALTRLADFSEERECNLHHLVDPLSDVPRCDGGVSEEEMT